MSYLWYSHSTLKLSPTLPLTLPTTHSPYPSLSFPLTLPTAHSPYPSLSLPLPSLPLTLPTPHSPYPLPSQNPPSLFLLSLPLLSLSACGPQPPLHQVSSKLSSIHVDLTPRPAHTMDELFAVVLSWNANLFLYPQKSECECMHVRTYIYTCVCVCMCECMCVCVCVICAWVHV